MQPEEESNWVVMAARDSRVRRESRRSFCERCNNPQDSVIKT
jgi:hypothetical protein